MNQWIHICQLYSDLMSTYGDQGNVRYLAYFLLQHRIRPLVTYHRHGELIPEADIYIFGGGQDQSQILVAKDLQGENGIRLSQFLQQSYCLAICGGYQLLGKYYLQKDGQSINGLGYLPIVTVASSKRLVGHVIIKRQFNDQQRTIVGFENHSGRTYIIDDSEPLGLVTHGAGNNGDDRTEGIIYQKTIGTYLHGPIFPRNPHLAYWWLKELLRAYGHVANPPRLEWEKAAHQAYLRHTIRTR